MPVDSRFTVSVIDNNTTALVVLHLSKDRIILDGWLSSPIYIDRPYRNDEQDRLISVICKVSDEVLSNLSLGYHVTEKYLFKKFEEYDVLPYISSTGRVDRIIASRVCTGVIPVKPILSYNGLKIGEPNLSRNDLFQQCIKPTLLIWIHQNWYTK